MDFQNLKFPEDSPAQLCSYSEVMGNSTQTAEAREVCEDTGNVFNRDTTQRQTDVARSCLMQMEPISNPDSCSSHTLSAEAATAAPDTRYPKRRRSDISGGLHPLEAAKRQRYGEDTGSTCASSQHRNRGNSLAAEAVSGVPRITPPSNETTSSSCHGRDNWPEVSLAKVPGLPHITGWFQHVRPCVPLPNAPPSPTKSLPETVPHRTIGLTVEEVNVPLREQTPEVCTLPTFAPRTGSIIKSRDREEIDSLPRIGDLVKDLDKPDINFASPRYSFHQPMVREPIFPGIFENRRWGFAKGVGNTTAVLVAGDWHPGPPLKPFDPVCYEDNALE